MTYVLIIHEDPSEREAMAAALAMDGIEACVARSEEEAIVFMHGDLPHTIVWNWPPQNMAAEIFVAVLRQDGFLGSLIICSATSPPRGVPFDVCLLKPFDLEELLRTVTGILLEDSIAPDMSEAYGTNY